MLPNRPGAMPSTDEVAGLKARRSHTPNVVRWDNSGSLTRWRARSTAAGTQSMATTSCSVDCRIGIRFTPVPHPASSTGPSSDVLLGLALLVVLLVVAALVRTRRAEQGMLVDDYAAFDDVSDEV